MTLFDDVLLNSLGDLFLKDLTVFDGNLLVIADVKVVDYVGNVFGWFSHFFDGFFLRS